MFVNPGPAPVLPAALLNVWSEIFSAADLSAAQEAYDQGFSPALRVNNLKSNPAAVETALKAANIAFSPAGFPGSWRTDRDGEYKLKVHPLAESGAVYLQSPSSQLPPHVVQALAPDAAFILDICAAPGGKTTQLASLYPNAEVVALERDKIRFQKLEFTVRRQSASNVRAFAMDALSPAKWISARTFDVVLVDAPCSGSGTVNVRNPKHVEVLSQDYDGYVVSRAAIQYRLLEAAFGYVKEGGLVVYSTCSVDPRENEAVINSILSKPGRSVVPCPDSVRAAVQASRNGLPSFRGQTYPAELSGTLRVAPSVLGEGFYCATLRKAA